MSKRNGSGGAEREGHVIDGQTGLVSPTPRPIKLSDLRSVRIELAHLYRAIDAGLIDSRDGSRRAYVLRQIADVITVAELEQRLIEIEEQQARNQALQGQNTLAAGLN